MAGDAAAIAAIYAPIVQCTHISFEEAVPSPEEMRARILRTLDDGYPWLVAADGDAILGYAYATRHRARAGYRWSVDSTVYLAEWARGQGIGKALYGELFERLRALRFHNVFAGIALPNDASVALHQTMGFTHVGTYRRVGHKLGAWYDTSWWQLRLTDDAAGPDEPLVPTANQTGRP